MAKLKQPNKKLIVAKFVEVPAKSKREFWQREYVLLGRLAERYSLEFLRDTSFSLKGESLAILFAPKILQDLDKRFKIYSSESRIIREPQIILQDNPLHQPILIERKQKTIRDFLNEKD
jgi:hypothetical protein